jgi:hypothetical protein
VDIRFVGGATRALDLPLPKSRPHKSITWRVRFPTFSVQVQRERDFIAARCSPMIACARHQFRVTLRALNPLPLNTLVAPMEDGYAEQFAKRDVRVRPQKYDLPDDTPAAKIR